MSAETWLDQTKRQVVQQVKALRAHPACPTGVSAAALASCGLSDYTRAETRITAKSAPAVLALALQVVEGAPVLRSVAINVDSGGVPVEFGTTWFAGDRVTLTVTADQP